MRAITAPLAKILLKYKINKKRTRKNILRERYKKKLMFRRNMKKFGLYMNKNLLHYIAINIIIYDIFNAFLLVLIIFQVGNKMKY